MEVYYDTGSDWLAVEGSNCVNCEGNTYDIEFSEEIGQAKQLATWIYDHSYWSFDTRSVEYTDKVCILFNACVDDYRFRLIVEQSGL